MAGVANRVIVYGGKGALGATVVSYFKSKNWWVASVDLFANEEAHGNVLVNPNVSWTEQESEVVQGVNGLLGEEKLDAVLCVAGGWAGGSAASSEFVKNADLMMKQSVWTSAIAARLASLHLKEAGLLVLTGASPARHGTPGMIGYGMAKAAVHQLVASLSAKGSGMPDGARCVGILPVTLDTPMNRKFMPKADFSTWTPLESVAEAMWNWTQETNAPAPGSLVELITKDGQTAFAPVTA